MTSDPRPHIHRRGHAIGRLRSLTSGVAVAGLAGTAGFGLLAAATWSGNPASTSASSGSGAAGLSEEGRSRTSTGLGSNTQGEDDDFAPFDQNVDSGGQQPIFPAPGVQRATGPGHASTGGSG